MASMASILEQPAVRRVRDALARDGVAAQIIELPGAARTARAAADFLGCEVGQIANSLVFRACATDRAVLVMSSGAKRVDTERLAALVGEPIAKADAEFVRARTGFAIGGVPPAGHAEDLLKYVDRSLAAYAELYAAAGHPHTIFRLTYEELLRITRGTATDLAAPA